MRLRDDRTLGDALAAGAVAALVSGTPSTVHALVAGARPARGVARGRHAAAPGRAAAGAPAARRRAVHLALSLGWALDLALPLPRRRAACFGALAGLGIAALDLGVIGRRFERIRALPRLPQVADHLAYGTTVGAVLSIPRARRS